MDDVKRYIDLVKELVNELEIEISEEEVEAKIGAVMSKKFAA